MRLFPWRRGRRSTSAVVFGLFSRDSDADIALNNLSEAGYPATGISVITSDPARTKALTDSNGPWSGLAPADLANRLQQAGLTAADSAAYSSGITGGNAFISIELQPPTAASAAEILTDQKATQVRTLPAGGGKVS